MSEVAFSVDWMRCTVENSGLPDLSIWVIGGDTDWTEKAGMPGYDEVWRTDLITVAWNSTRPHMRTMLQMDGQQLSEARQSGITEKNLLNMFLARGGRFTRLDFAVDVMNSDGDVLDVECAWKNGTIETQARKIVVITSETTETQNGNTVYLGSRQSMRMVRVYDKGKQLKTELDWIRIEMEWKKERAQQLARDMYNQGIRNAGLQHLRNFIPNSQVAWFEDAIEGKYTEFCIDAIGRVPTDREKWIFNVLLPVLAEAVFDEMPGVEEVIIAMLDEKENRDKHGPKMILPRPGEKD